MTVFDDFEKIVTLGLCQRLEGKVIEDQEVSFSDLGQAPAKRAITAAIRRLSSKRATRS